MDADVLVLNSVTAYSMRLVLLVLPEMSEVTGRLDVPAEYAVIETCSEPCQMKKIL